MVICVYLWVFSSTSIVVELKQTLCAVIIVLQMYIGVSGVHANSMDGLGTLKNVLVLLHIERV